MIGYTFMQDQDKTKEQLIDELNVLRRRTDQFEVSESSHLASENKMKRESSKYRQMINKASEGVIVYQEGYISFANDACAKMSGYSKEELFSNYLINDLVHPDDRERIQTYQELRLDGERTIYNYQFRLACKDKNIKWVEANSSLVMWRGRPAELAFLTDITKRKQAEDALLSTLSRFYTILSSMYSAVLLVTNDGVVEFANQAFCDLFDLQLPPDKLRELKAPEMIRKIIGVYANPERSLSRIIEIVAENQPVKGEEIALADGRTYIVDFIPIIIDGKPYGRFWHHTDISERKRIEEALRQSEEKYRTIFERSPLGIIHFDSNGVVIESNQALLDIMGSKREMTIGFDLASSLKNEALRIAVESVFSGKSGHYDGEYTSVTGDKTIWMNLVYAPFIGRDGLVSGGIGIVQDMTEHKRVENAAWRLASIVESSDDAIIGKTLDGTITSWNKGAESLYGYRSDEVIGQPVSILLTPELCDDFRDILIRIIRGEAVSHFETKRRTKDGRIVDMSLTISPIKTPEGKIIGASSTARDITERKLLEKERQKVFVELQKALSEVKKLSGLIPICSSCKKIRDDNGYWSEVERYIGEHSGAQFSHGICPDCIRKLYPEYADEVLGQLEKDDKEIESG